MGVIGREICISGLVPQVAERIGLTASPLLQAGHFTHIYAACGYFDQVDPIACYSCLPEDRSIFDLASLTKALVTTPLIYQEAIESGLSMAASVGTWLGRAATKLDPPLLAMSIESLLSHNSGLPAWRNFWIHRLGIGPIDQSSRHSHIETILNRHASAIKPPGEFTYSDLGFILLGLILEKRKNSGLDRVFRQFRDGLVKGGCRDEWLDFAPSRAICQRAVPTSTCALRGHVLCGEVHDENCAALGGVSGHAGLFGSGPAVIDYLRRLVASEIGQRVVETNAARLQPGGDPLMGWRQRSRLPMPKLVFGHLGFTGTAFFLDRRAKCYGVLLTNRVISGRLAPWIAGFRNACMDIMESGLEI